MNRGLTNIIRFFMDEFIPPVIRDNRFFMYPFFFIWFKGGNIRFFMNFKSHVYGMSEEEFQNVYKQLESLAVDRVTDLNSKCVDYMLKNLDPSARNLLDVGCGRGYWLDRVAEDFSFKLTGCDIYDNVNLKRANYVKASIEDLPFDDKSFDIVTCHHTIEHIRKLEKAISELKRVAKK
ncbi:MAG: class I SAM-dependent methyltransferase, partial [Ignavibacteria bacterium]